MKTLLRLFSFVISLLLGVLGLVFPGDGSHKLQILTQERYQEFEGFGTSGAWWAQMIAGEADSDMLAQALFNRESGLGLDIYRYNVGAGEKDNPNTRIHNEEKRRTESFYVLNPETGKYEYDFTRDANARRMLDKAIANGAQSVILFCNSPHFSMTKSGQASGGLTEYESNLPRENYKAFVDYLLTIADWFVAQGYPIRGISPINEPNWGWGGDWVGQEGCHYTAAKAAELLCLFAKEMVERGSSYQLYGPELGDLWVNNEFYQSLLLNNPNFRKVSDSFDGHSYGLDHNLWKKWAIGSLFEARYPQWKFNMSEWCELPCKTDAPSIESGMVMANVIVEDLTLLQAVTWQSWTAVSGPALVDGKNITDGLICEYDNFGRFELCNRYYAYRQFTSFIRPGATRIGLRDSKGFFSKLASVAFADGEDVVLVLVNNEGKDIKVQLDGSYASMQIITTDDAHNCEQTYDGAFNSAITLGDQSVTTILLKK